MAHCPSLPSLSSMLSGKGRGIHVCGHLHMSILIHSPKKQLPLDGPGGETHTSSGNRLRAESFKAWGWRHPIKRTEQNISKQNLSNIYVHEDHLESTLERRFPGPTPRDEALVSLGWGPRIFISNNLHKMLMKQKRTLSHPRQVQRPPPCPLPLFCRKAEVSQPSLRHKVSGSNG